MKSEQAITIGEALMSPALIEAAFDETPDALQAKIGEQHLESASDTRIVDIVASRYAIDRFHRDQIVLLDLLEDNELAAQFPSTPIKIDYFEAESLQLLDDLHLTDDDTDPHSKSLLRIGMLATIDPLVLQRTMRQVSKNLMPIEQDAQALVRMVNLQTAYLAHVMTSACNLAASLGIGSDRSFPRIAMTSRRALGSFRSQITDFE